MFFYLRPQNMLSGNNSGLLLFLLFDRSHLFGAPTTHREKSAIPRVLHRWSTIGDDFIVSLPTLHPETPMLNPNKAGEHTNREAFSLGRGFRPTDRKLIVLLRN